jgi:hypothetical protein
MSLIRQRNVQTNVKIKLSARFNARHYGYFSDIVQGIPNTAWIGTGVIKKNTNNPAIIARYVDTNGTPLIPNHTSCSNLDEANRIFGPYNDEVIPEQLIDRVEYIENTNDTVTTIIS